MKRCWDTMESPFTTFAAWVDERGRLLRFHLRAAGAARVTKGFFQTQGIAGGKAQGTIPNSLPASKTASQSFLASALGTYNSNPPAPV